jgi:hypothetical protein
MDVRYATEQELEAYLSGISAARLKRLRWPKQSWRGRGRCYGFFESGMKPSNISPRMCGVSRNTLYLYYGEWRLLKAQNRLGFLRVERQIIEERSKRQSQRM